MDPLETYVYPARPERPNRIVNNCAITVWKDAETQRVIAAFPEVVTSGETEEDAIQALKGVIELAVNWFARRGNGG